MMFRHSKTGVDMAQLEELRSQDARKALERECRTLRRQFSALEKEYSALRTGYEHQCQRLDSVVAKTEELTGLVNKAGVGTNSFDTCTLKDENSRLTADRILLLRRNAELEIQIETVMAQFGSLLSDYEDVRGKLGELKSAINSANSIEELGGWETL
jgi:hypothetical protein